MLNLQKMKLKLKKKATSKINGYATYPIMVVAYKLKFEIKL